MFQTATVTNAANTLMKAVVASGAVNEANIETAVCVMRAELKAFLFEERYAALRETTMNGRENLAMAAIVAECVAQITKGETQ